MSCFSTLQYWSSLLLATSQDVHTYNTIVTDYMLIVYYNFGRSEETIIEKDVPNMYDMYDYNSILS